MNSDAKIRNKYKIAEKPGSNTYKITHIVLNNCSLVPTLISN